MAVPVGQAATTRLRELLDVGVADGPYADTADLPAGVSADPPASWLWAPSGATERPLRDEQAYVLVADVTDPLAALVHQAPNAVLTGTGALTAEQEAYCRASLDVTMKGGTTSGVVYPAALCELARHFRFRNVGGASAGAIAATLAAAAELGRVGWEADGRPDLVRPDGPAREQGRLRPGFAGLADATAWFSEVDDGPTDQSRPEDQFRVAQLFRPTERARPVFRLLVAAMRARWVAFGALLLGSFGRLPRLLTVLLLALTPLLAVLGTPAVRESGVLRAWLYAAFVLGVVTAGVVLALAAVLIGVRRRRASDHPPPALAEPVAPRPDARSASPVPLAVGALAAAGVLVLLGLLPGWSAIGTWRLLGAWLLLVVALVVVQLLAVLRIVATAKRERFGLVSGSRPAAGSTAGRFWDRVAGVAPARLDDALVPWLHRATSDLAGLAGSDGRPQVLRFGHLWLGRAYAAPGSSARTPEVEARLREAEDVPRCRVVNLELMSTEVVHGVPYRFPLRSAARPDEQLYLRRADLEQPGAEVFPPEVVEALCPSGTLARGRFCDVETGDAVDGLHPLPEMGDLPVLLATRMSLALPGLFQAVRLYRLAGPPYAVRDDYGARLIRDGRPLRYPGEDDVTWVEELWFSDGGITSNFPIHLFDTPLPLWPTVGINLGTHPRGHAHQDVWLPGPSQARSSPPTPQRGSLLGFAGAVVGTALGWSDTGQTFMPAFRGRVAWVRQRADEGGSNLYMSSETVASLALRGALAGRRLARRYASDAHWRVHQWLRLRVALDNLATLHGRVARAARTPPYATLTSRAAINALKDALDAAGGDPTPARAPHGGPAPDGVLDWFDADVRSDFFTATADLLDRYTAAPRPRGDPAPLHEDVPEPTSQLRQVPWV